MLLPSGPPSKTGGNIEVNHMLRRNAFENQLTCQQQLLHLKVSRYSTANGVKVLAKEIGIRSSTIDIN